MWFVLFTKEKRLKTLLLTIKASFIILCTSGFFVLMKNVYDKYDKKNYHTGYQVKG